MPRSREPKRVDIFGPPETNDDELAYNNSYKAATNQFQTNSDYYGQQIDESENYNAAYDNSMNNENNFNNYNQANYNDHYGYNNNNNSYNNTNYNEGNHAAYNQVNYNSTGVAAAFDPLSALNNANSFDNNRTQIMSSGNVTESQGIQRRQSQVNKYSDYENSNDSDNANGLASGYSTPSTAPSLSAAQKRINERKLIAEKTNVPSSPINGGTEFKGQNVTYAAEEQHESSLWDLLMYFVASLALGAFMIFYFIPYVLCSGCSGVTESAKESAKSSKITEADKIKPTALADSTKAAGALSATGSAKAAPTASMAGTKMPIAADIASKDTLKAAPLTQQPVKLHSQTLSGDLNAAAKTNNAAGNANPYMSQNLYGGGSSINHYDYVAPTVANKAASSNNLQKVGMAQGISGGEMGLDSVSSKAAGDSAKEAGMFASLTQMFSGESAAEKLDDTKKAQNQLMMNGAGAQGLAGSNGVQNQLAGGYSGHNFNAQAVNQQQNFNGQAMNAQLAGGNPQQLNGQPQQFNNGAYVPNLTGGGSAAVAQQGLAAQNQQGLMAGANHYHFYGNQAQNAVPPPQNQLYGGSNNNPQNVNSNRNDAMTAGSGQPGNTMPQSGYYGGGDSTTAQAQQREQQASAVDNKSGGCSTGACIGMIVGGAIVGAAIFGLSCLCSMGTDGQNYCGNCCKSDESGSNNTGSGSGNAAPAAQQPSTTTA